MALAPDRGTRLLQTYDSALEGKSINSIARRLRSQGTELGNTVGAIAKQIRRLVEEREKRAYRARAEARRWRMAMLHEPPTLPEQAVNAARPREKCPPLFSP